MIQLTLDVEALVQQLFTADTLNGFDFKSTVFNFMLPSGTILNTDEAPTGGAISAKAEKLRTNEKAAGNAGDLLFKGE